MCRAPRAPKARPRAAGWSVWAAIAASLFATAGVSAQAAAPQPDDLSAHRAEQIRQADEALTKLRPQLEQAQRVWSTREARLKLAREAEALRQLQARFTQVDVGPLRVMVTPGEEARAREFFEP